LFKSERSIRIKNSAQQVSKILLKFEIKTRIKGLRFTAEEWAGLRLLIIKDDIEYRHFKLFGGGLSRIEEGF